LISTQRKSEVKIKAPRKSAELPTRKLELMQQCPLRHDKIPDQITVEVCFQESCRLLNIRKNHG